MSTETETMPGVVSWMTAEAAAQIANDCNEGLARKHSKFELTEGLRWWAMKCSLLAGELAQLKHVAKFEQLVERLETAALSRESQAGKERA